MTSTPQLPVSFSGVHMVFPSLFSRPVTALRGLNLEVPAGAVVGLLGPNGCGKTTSISCLLGLLTPQAGKVCLFGQPVRPQRWQAATQAYGVLLEDTRLPAFLSVRRALKLICELKGFFGPARRIEFDRIVAEVGIADLLSRKVKVLSKGQARKVGLAAALCGDPLLLILDEPSAGLDVAARLAFDALLRSLRDGRRTVLIASHLLGDIENTCTHVAIMQGGKIRFFGETRELLGSLRGEGVGSAVYINKSAAEVVSSAEIQCQDCTYQGLVQIYTELSDLDLLGKLVELKVTPVRIEPKIDLVSKYLDLVNHQEEQ